MTLRLNNISFDVLNAKTVATFWAAALDLELAGEPTEHFAKVGGPNLPAGHPGFMFAKVPEPKQFKNRMHIDVAAPDGDVPTEIARLESLGATQVETRNAGSFQWTVMADPEGNEFCISPDH